MNNFEFL